MAPKTMLAIFAAGAILALAGSAHAATSLKPGVGGSQPAPRYHALTGVLVRSICLQNECQWFRIDQSTLVRQSDQASMFEIKLSNWYSDYPDGNYAKARPRTSSGTGTSYVVCSTTEPSLIEKEDGPGWTQSQLAPGDKDQISDAVEPALAIYWAACHMRKVEDADAVAALANKLGYPRTIAADELAQRMLIDPLDGFRGW